MTKYLPPLHPANATALHAPPWPISPNVPGSRPRNSTRLVAPNTPPVFSALFDPLPPFLLLFVFPLEDLAPGAGRSRSTSATVPSPHAAATSRRVSAHSKPFAHATAWTIGGLHIGAGPTDDSPSIDAFASASAAASAAARSPTRHVATGVVLEWSHLHTTQSSPPDTTSYGLWSRN